MKTVADLQDDVAGLLQGTNLDSVTNLFGAFERAVSLMSQKAFVPEATGRQIVTLYSGVTDYLAPDSIFGGALTDFRPIGISRTPYDIVYRQPIELFDRTKCWLPNGYQLTFEYDAGIAIMRFASRQIAASTVLDPMTSVTGWSAGGTASAPVADYSFYYQSPASLRFDLAGTGTGWIEKTLQTSIDLTRFRGVGVAFLAAEIPVPADVSSIALRIGSDSSNYYQISNAEGFLGAWKAGYFQLTDFDLAGVTPVGSPDMSKIQYVRASFAHTAPVVNIRCGDLFISLPSPHEILFKSPAVFESAGQLSSDISGINNTIILNNSAYNILQHEAAMTIALQSGGSFAEGTISSLNQILHGVRTRTGAVVQLGLYDLYRADNPTEEIKSIGNWYDDIP